VGATLAKAIQILGMHIQMAHKVIAAGRAKPERVRRPKVIADLSSVGKCMIHPRLNHTNDHCLKQHPELAPPKYTKCERRHMG
jgi:hypothetical protein